MTKVHCTAENIVLKACDENGQNLRVRQRHVCRFLLATAGPTGLPESPMKKGKRTARTHIFRLVDSSQSGPASTVFWRKMDGLYLLDNFRQQQDRQEQGREGVQDTRNWFRRRAQGTMPHGSEQTGHLIYFIVYRTPTPLLIVTTFPTVAPGFAQSAHAQHG